MTKNSPHFQPGNAMGTTAFVFSCPGAAEEYCGRPASGKTGDSLNRALECLHNVSPGIFPYSCKSQYLITNAWAQVEYTEKTKRSEAKDSEILTKANIARLTQELVGQKVVVACGLKAQKAVAACGFASDVEILKASHLSPKVINTRFPVAADIHVEIRAIKRIESWCEELLGECV